MKPTKLTLAGLGFAIALVSVWYFADLDRSTPDAYAETPAPTSIVPVNVMQVNTPPADTQPVDFIFPDEDVKPMPSFVSKGLEWLVKAQFDNGGWGAGMHDQQQIRDPKAVQIDPATTAFSAMALLRAGNTLDKGPYKKNLENALLYMVELVESAPKEGQNITTISGTQPQAKLGRNIDVSMAAQLFTRVLPTLDDRPKLENRVRVALQICLDKLAGAQSADGSWNDRGGWASVLQSAMANNAFELAENLGMDFDEAVLERSRDYQKSNVDAETGDVRTESAAGISLYSITSNQRSTAKQAKRVQDLVEKGKSEGRIDAAASPSVSTLQELGVDKKEAEALDEAYRQNAVTRELLKDDNVLRGFGNNGGEEFLSHMMTSESLVLTGGEDWEAWYAKLHNLLASIQNEDGSWSGHHCITSPVFCTAAVIMAMLADRDRELLLSESQEG